ncbi:LOW QUALITY PROTEIN: rab proteins geranylgeranyltransferase component A [Lepeophtheirus salmonis]|uniref:LOW QUALITY PROTEIN: rab proteins geranylgeranyltransferase component A n=1 Tax=Lepeophtheirus salmonis TaxID=72036 RepID=UPI003AF3F1AD
MSNELPEHFDAVVLGTGFEESILAGAIARAGHSILHLDPNDYYGGEWASFNFEGIQGWIESQNSPKESDIVMDCNRILLNDDEDFIPLKKVFSRFSNVNQTWYPQEVKEKEHEAEKDCNKREPSFENTLKECSDDIKNNISSINKVWNQERVVSESRKFNLDLIPKLLYTSGPLVELLISSNVSRYLEFKAFNRVLTTTPDGKGLDHVPSSRADVFSTQKISVVEKRILMKFLTFALNYESHYEVYSEYVNKTFESFLKKERLTPNLIHFLMNSIALVEKDSDTLEGLRSTKKFLSSLGRFGSNTPYLWTVFGGGELPQAFCRLCAVFGGTYYLGQSVQGIIVKSGSKVSGVIINGGKKTRVLDKFIANEGYLSPDLKSMEESETIYRNISVVKDSVIQTDTEKISSISIPLQLKDGSGSFAFVQEVGHGAAICPKGLYVRHTTSKLPYEPFKFESTNSFIWSLQFSIEGRLGSTSNQSPKYSNLFYTSGPAFELDYDVNIDNVKKMFQNIYPEDEFLPRAPDPEEIILGDDPTESSDQEKNDEGTIESNQPSNFHQKDTVDENSTEDDLSKL